MSKQNIFLLIFAILFFLGALAFLLSTFSDNTNISNNTINNSNNLIFETSPLTPDDTTTPEDTTNISDTSDSTSENLPNLELESLIDFTYLNKENEEFTLSQYKDKPLAILFSDFAESKDLSEEYLSLLNQFYAKYSSKVQFLCIDKTSSATTDSNIKIYQNKNGIENYSIETLPTLVFIDKDGKIINKTDSITLDSLEANLDLITENF